MAWVEKRGKTYTVCWRETDEIGNDGRKRVSGFATKEDAWAAARDLEHASLAGIDVHGDTQTCGYWMERWFAESCSGRVEQTTLSKYSAGMDVLRECPVYALSVRKLTRQTFLATFSTIKNNGKRSIRRCLDITEPWRFSLSWAEKEGYIPINPLRGIRLPKAEKRRQVVLNDTDMAVLASESLKTTTSPKKGSVRGGAFGLAVHLALYGGLRREEAAALTWENVDFSRNTVTIIAAHVRDASGKRIIKAPKTIASQRTITMPKFVMKLMRSTSRTSEYVCANSDGAPLELSGYAQAVRRLIERINKQRKGTTLPLLPKVSYHDLRHTHAAYLIRLGLHAKVIQERLGHTSIKITMDLYGYLMTGLQESAASAMDAAQSARTHKEKSGGKSGGTRSKSGHILRLRKLPLAPTNEPESAVK